MTTDSTKQRYYSRRISLLAFIAVIIYFAVKNPDGFLRTVIMLASIGVVIFVHEFGHFLACKFLGIKVEAFAIGMGQVVLGLKKTAAGVRVRFLPDYFPSAGDDPEKLGKLNFIFAAKGREGETEYQLRLVPVGGFVKPLGQEDIGANKKSDDPRAFTNAAIWKRIVMASAGVACNLVLAMVIFIVIFLRGYEMPPAVVGGVLPDFPAANAGLRPGDEIIEINGRGDLDFTSISMAAALSGKDEKVAMKVRHPDGSVEDFRIAAKKIPQAGMKGFGILPPVSVKIAAVAEPNFLEAMGLRPGDTIIAVNSQPVEYAWQIAESLKGVFARQVNVTILRGSEPDKQDILDVPVNLSYGVEYNPDINDENDLANLLGVIPPIRITEVINSDTAEVLRDGDVIKKAGDVDWPSFCELRTTAGKYAGKDMPIEVVRDGNIVCTAVRPRIEKDGLARFGVGVAAYLDEPIVAKALADINNPAVRGLPRGAKITAVNNETVADYFDIRRIIETNRGKSIAIAYDVNGTASNIAATAVIPADGNIACFNPDISADIPLEPLKRIYKAQNPVGAISMGVKKTIDFVLQTYMTIRSLITRDVSPKNLMGPIGMINAGAQIIEQRNFMHFLYFMGLISACLSVMNFLPLPILDGGLVVLLIIEKIKGSPVHEKIQEAITYAGVAMLATLFVVVTWNDIMRIEKVQELLHFLQKLIGG